MVNPLAAAPLPQSERGGSTGLAWAIGLGNLQMTFKLWLFARSIFTPRG